jgi:uncharacterized protein YbjQ (UPF0145 family)
MDKFARVVFAGPRVLVDGEIIEYTKMLVQVLERAIDRMVEESEGLRADAIGCGRIATSPVMAGAIDVLAHGTAVRPRPRPVEVQPVRFG